VKQLTVPDWLLEQSLPIGPGDHPLRGVIADAVEALPVDLRRTLEMWAWEGLTYGQIAAEFGLAGRSSGHKRVRWALAELRKLLEEEHGIAY
jgi:DNA-directed RNA polymerase specialized sigma24 family protein